MSEVYDLRPRLAAKAAREYAPPTPRSEPHFMGSPGEVMDNFQTHAFGRGDICRHCSAAAGGIRAEWPCGRGAHVPLGGKNMLVKWGVVRP